MENPVPPNPSPVATTPIATPQPSIPSMPPQPTPKVNKLIPLVILLLVFVGAIAAYSLAPKKQPAKKSTTPSHQPYKKPDITIEEALTTKGVFTADKKFAQIGKETIYGKDLNYALYTTFYKEFSTKSAKIDTLRDLALRKLVQDSMLLQIGEKNNYIVLSDKVYNNPNKDYTLRQKAILEVINYLEKQEEKISGAKLSIWYYNMEQPKIDEKVAETIAKEKLTQIRNDIVAKKITFEEGKNRIVSDTQLSQIDRNYKGNAYTEFSDKSPTEGFFSSPGLDQQLLALKEGDVSQVLQYPPANKQSDERFFYILTVTKRSNAGSGSIEQLLQKEKANYPVSLL